MAEGSINKGARGVAPISVVRGHDTIPDDRRPEGGAAQGHDGHALGHAYSAPPQINHLYHPDYHDKKKQAHEE